jgi:hypothetical protein
MVCRNLGILSMTACVGGVDGKWLRTCKPVFTDVSTK